MQLPAVRVGPRCEVCVTVKKGHCGTDRAHRNCLKRLEYLAAVPTAAPAANGGGGEADGRERVTVWHPGLGLKHMGTRAPMKVNLEDWLANHPGWEVWDGRQRPPSSRPPSSQSSQGAPIPKTTPHQPGPSSQAPPHRSAQVQQPAAPQGAWCAQPLVVFPPATTPQQVAAHEELRDVAERVGAVIIFGNAHIVPHPVGPPPKRPKRDPAAILQQRLIQTPVVPVDDLPASTPADSSTPPAAAGVPTLSIFPAGAPNLSTSAAGEASRVVPQSDAKETPNTDNLIGLTNMQAGDPERTEKETGVQKGAEASEPARHEGSGATEALLNNEVVVESVKPPPDGAVAADACVQEVVSNGADTKQEDGLSVPQTS